MGALIPCVWDLSGWIDEICGRLLGEMPKCWPFHAMVVMQLPGTVRCDNHQSRGNVYRQEIMDMAAFQYYLKGTG
jgi:hypothetical protein